MCTCRWDWPPRPTTTWYLQPPALLCLSSVDAYCASWCLRICPKKCTATYIYIHGRPSSDLLICQLLSCCNHACYLAAVFLLSMIQRLSSNDNVAWPCRRVAHAYSIHTVDMHEACSSTHTRHHLLSGHELMNRLLIIIYAHIIILIHLRN
jgi:hypothetical protein